MRFLPVVQKWIGRKTHAKDVSVCLIYIVCHLATVVCRRVVVAGNSPKGLEVMRTWGLKRAMKKRKGHRLHAEGMVRILCEVVRSKWMEEECDEEMVVVGVRTPGWFGAKNARRVRQKANSEDYPT